MRKCSYCGHKGHNSRTCNEKGCVKLFGVNINRSLSTGDLDGYVAPARVVGHVEKEGYNSDECHDGRERKKGKSWTEHEHRSFLAGLMRQGKGDWRGISKNFVKTRTPTQVASHAQKYFMRKEASAERKRRRSSVFDVTLPGFGNPSSSEALKDNVEPQHQTMKSPTMEMTPSSSTMPPAILPYYMSRVQEWTSNMRPCHTYVPYSNGEVHRNQVFSKPPICPPSSSKPGRLDSLELRLKVGESLPQIPRTDNLAHNASESGLIGVTT